LWASTLGWILLRILNSTGRNGRVAVILVSAYVANSSLNLLTSGLQQSSGEGLMILGTGEAVRSFVLLGGVILSLEGRRQLVTLIAKAMIPAALMALAGWQIHVLVDGTIARLLAGGIALALCMAIATAILLPGSWRSGMARMRAFSTEGKT